MTEFSGETVETKKYDVAELTRLFGDTMPVEAVNLLFDSPGDMTLGQVREKIMEMAAKWSGGKPVTADDVIADYLRMLNGMATQIDLRFIDMAKALRDRLSDHGFAIVPRVATDEMLMAPELDMLATGAEARVIWKAMIEAATRGQS